MRERFKEYLEQLQSKNLLRFLRTVESDQGPEIIFEGKKYLNFSSNNYLGLANHPYLKQAAIEAVEKYGTGSGASRLITGSMSLHEELEKKIAAFKGTESALIFNSGTQANMGAIPALVGENDFIFSDELNHASLIDGYRLSKAKIEVYRHGDVGHVGALLAAPPNKGVASSAPTQISPIDGRSQGSPLRIIITDSIFSMDGDIAPLPEIMALAKKYDCLVYVDEAHGTGVFGKSGKGVVEHFGIDPKNHRLIQMGTLGKALGSFGAYIAGSKDLIDFLINKARTFIFSTSLPPAVLAASKAAIELIEKDPSHREKLWENVRYFSRVGAQFIAPTGMMNHAPTSPILPIIIGDAKKTMEVAQQLFEHGIWATGIRPPTVPEGTSRIRLTIMASHTKEHLDRCLEAINKLFNK